jgi:hypothetical protein
MFENKAARQGMTSKTAKSREHHDFIGISSARLTGDRIDSQSPATA